MELKEKKFNDNIEALKKAIGETITVKASEPKEGEEKKADREIKGHVFCEEYRCLNTKVDGYSNLELISEKKLVEAAHALHQTKNYKTTHKIFLIV